MVKLCSKAAELLIVYAANIIIGLVVTTVSEVRKLQPRGTLDLSNRAAATSQIEWIKRASVGAMGPALYLHGILSGTSDTHYQLSFITICQSVDAKLHYFMYVSQSSSLT